MRRAGWWVKWSVRHFPVLAWRRLTSCRRDGHGPLYDCEVCLTCGAPWFGGELYG